MSGAIDRLIPSELVERQRDPRLVDVGSEEGEAVVDALTAATARRILVALREEPRPPSELAEDLDLTAQNVHHHLESLKEAELIEPAGTRYSEKGTEMTVYAPANDPLLLCSARESDRSLLRSVVARLFAGVLVVGVVTAAFSVIVDRLRPEPAYLAEHDEVALETATRAEPATHVVTPELAFLLGGLATLTVVLGWWILREWQA